MDTNSIDNVREIVHSGSIILLVIAVAIAFLAAFRPQFFRGVFQEFSERKYIIGTAIFICLLCGTVFTATQPTPSTLQSNAVKTTIENDQEFIEEPTNESFSETETQPIEEPRDDPNQVQSSLSVNAQLTPSSPTTEMPKQSTSSQTPAAGNQSAPTSPSSSTPDSPKAEPEKKRRLSLLGGRICL